MGRRASVSHFACCDGVRCRPATRTSASPYRAPVMSASPRPPLPEADPIRLLQPIHCYVHLRESRDSRPRQARYSRALGVRWALTLRTARVTLRLTAQRELRPTCFTPSAVSGGAREHLESWGPSIEIRALEVRLSLAALSSADEKSGATSDTRFTWRLAPKRVLRRQDHVHRRSVKTGDFV